MRFECRQRGVPIRPFVVGAMAVACALALSACGSDDDESAGGGDDADAGGGTKLTVGVIPIVDTAPVWLGVDKGFFDDAGIDLELVPTSGGAASVPGVINGEFDLAFGNVVSLMVANDQGLNLKFVTNGTSTSGTEGEDFSGVVVPEGSAITRPADLEGATVSVNNLNNIGDTTIRRLIEEDGGDPSAVDFVEVPFPEAPAALSKGQVDAAWILEPFLSQAISDGGTVISWNYVETSPMLDIAGYFTSTTYIEDNADVVASFTEAMNTSLEYAQEHPDEVRDIVGTYTEMDEPTRQAMVLPAFRKDFDRESMQMLGAAAAKYGTLTAEPDLDALLP